MRTYDITFDKTKYAIYGYDWWNFSIYDNNNKTVLWLNETGFIIDHNRDDYRTINKIAYTKEEQDIKQIGSYIKNDIKYFMKQYLTFKRLQHAHVLKF